MTKKPTIGIIGMGIMGFAMAQNAKKAGFPILVYNRGVPHQDQAKEAGLTICATPRELADQSEAVVIMVTDPAAVKNVLSGPDGVLSGNVQNKTLIQMSTIDEKSTLAFAKEAEEKGMAFLDCPVAGSKKQVESAQLILLAGSEDDILTQWKGFLLSVGKAIVHAGPVGKGTALKLCMNLLVAQMTTALCESLALAKVQGVEPEKVFDVIDQSPALNNGYYQIKKSNLLDDDFTPAFSLENMLKDVRFMTAAAKENRLPLPVTNAVQFLMEGALTEGFGKEDLSSISKLLRSKGER